MLNLTFFLSLQLEKETNHLHPPRSPNATHSNNSTLESKQNKVGIKKIISDKIIPTTLERNKKEKKDGLPSTLERENEKNIKMANKRHSDIPSSLNMPDRNKIRYSDGHMIQPESGTAYFEHAEVQKRENDPKKAMKFGIRVLPPNIPDDGVLKQKSVENGNVITVDRKIIYEPDKPSVTVTTQIRHENETEVKKPVVAKRREKMAPPVPNARTKASEIETKSTQVINTDGPLTFSRSDLNSSGIKRDENGIPQELPQHMFDAAKAARNNRKSSSELIYENDMLDTKKDEAPKLSKKSKGKAPSPPEIEKNKTDDSILEQLKNVHDFLNNEKQHSSLLHDSSKVSMDTTTISYNTSTPKSVKMKSVSRIEDSINFSQDDIDDIVSKPFKRESDSLNNFYEDSKSNLSSSQDVYSIVSLNQSDKSDKGSTTIELNNSDITIHSSPNDTLQSVSDNASLLDENERKAASLGDLSRFELRAKATKPSSGTLERAQSLDISADDAESSDNALGPKKRKAKSVVETNFFENSGEDILPDMIDSVTGIIIKHKEPRLSLNIAKTSAMEGLNTFQRNRLKKGSEFGNLEDAIVKGSSSSIDSEKTESQEYCKKEIDVSRIDEPHESSDHLARRIMDENIKVHLKLVSEFAKSTSDGSNMSSLDSSREARTPSPTKVDPPIKYDKNLTISYDTNIPDDLKVSRNTYVNSLERPKSEMMKKLLAKNPILNVHIDEATTSQEKPTPRTDSSKSTIHQPDIVNFDLKASEKVKQSDYDDFVSNIRVGSNNNSLKYNKSPESSYTADWKETKPKEVVSSSVVTINTNQKTLPSERKYGNSYTKSIEIGEPARRLIPDVIEGIKRRAEEREGKTFYMEPPNVALTMTHEPAQKTVTVNVAEDGFGNKVITQNVEKISTKYLSGKSEAPLQVEQISFGIMKNPGDINQVDLDEGNVKDFDKSVLDEIKRQNPNIQFTTDEPAYTKTETILLDTELDEEEAVALMEKIKNDPSFMAQKTPQELSQLGIRIIRDLEDIKHETHDTIELSQTRYSINPSAISDSQKHYTIQSLKDRHEEKNKDHVTEIKVLTPRTEKMIQQKTEIKDKVSSRQRAPTDVTKYEENPTYDLDIELLNDFISNEKYHTAKQQSDSLKRTKTTQSEPKKRHSDFDLPRNPRIMFRTATYESPKGTIVTSTDIENRRLSQLDQMQLRAMDEQNAAASKPSISTKPSNIPVKADKKSVGNSSKIPVFMSQKSLSSENLTEKTFSLPRSPPPNLSSSSGNISVTSIIKSSSKHPSGKF